MFPSSRHAGKFLFVTAAFLLTLRSLWEQRNAYVKLLSIVHLPSRHMHHDKPSASFDVSSQLPISLEEHTYTHDGLLIVNPNGSHPIFELMRNAETAWNEKLVRASQTLDEAVVEYKRRYKRPPPLGFDKWWEYVIQHNVQLPDEYDEIYHDLEPYWGLEPIDIAKTLEELGEQDIVFTILKTPFNSGLEIVNSTLPQPDTAHRTRIDAIIELAKDFASDLPPMHILISPYDNPSKLTDWRIKRMVLDAARSGTAIKQYDLPPVTEAGWIQGCPPDSPARLHPAVLPSPDTTPALLVTDGPKSFIASHRRTMDPCQHPELLVTHGQFLSHENGPFPEKTFVPRFSHCGSLLHHDIRPPTPYGWVSSDDAEAAGDVPWSEKHDERVDWRGSTTGIYASPSTLWRHSHRQRLVSLTNMLAWNVSVLHAPPDASIPVGESRKMPLGQVNPAWMDMAFVEQALACKADGGTCELMEEMFEFRRRQGQKTEGQYKFIFDIDGHGWSGRFKRLISGNALIFKATVYPEWYTSRIAEWVHYVPIQVSYSDLYDAVAFFRTHDEAAAKIASAGKQWSQRFWRKEDMSAYLYRLLLEYARVTSPNRAEMFYEG